MPTNAPATQTLAVVRLDLEVAPPADVIEMGIDALTGIGTTAAGDLDHDLGRVMHGAGDDGAKHPSKGYIVVGQDTDGTVTPDDAGLAWTMGKRKD